MNVFFFHLLYFRRHSLPLDAVVVVIKTAASCVFQKVLRINVPKQDNFDELLDDDALISAVLSSLPVGTLDCEKLVKRCWALLLANCGGVIEQTDTKWNRSWNGPGAFNCKYLIFLFDFDSKH